VGRINLAGLQTDGNAGAEAIRFPILRTSSGGRRLTPESTSRGHPRYPRWLVVWGPAAGWAVVLFLLSELQGVPLRPWVALNDKAVHLALYSVLGGLLGWATFASRRPRWPGNGIPPFVAICVGWLYGLSDELHQAFVPGRTPSVGDWLADAVGVVVGYVVARYLLTAVADRGMFANQPRRDLA